MATPYNKVRLSGTMPGGEVWSVNPCFGRVDGSAVDDYQSLQTWAEAIADRDDGNVLEPAHLQLLSSAGRLTQVRTEYYNAAGILADVAEVNLNPTVAGAFAPNKPYQSSLVSSLRTARPGRSYRGRLYWPALFADLSVSNLRVGPEICQALADDTVTLLNSIAALGEPAAVLQPIVVSQTLGLNSVITRVEVGNVLDVQRRRRDALEENYYTTPIVPV